jgi:hypothetical protein
MTLTDFNGHAVVAQETNPLELCLCHCEDVVYELLMFLNWCAKSTGLC